MMNGWVESEPCVWMVAVTLVPVPRKPSIDEYHRTVNESPSGSLAVAVKVMSAPKRPVSESKTARWLDMLSGVAVVTVGARFPDGSSGAMVVVVVVVVGATAVVVVLVGGVLVVAVVTDVVVVAVAAVVELVAAVVSPGVVVPESSEQADRDRRRAIPRADARWDQGWVREIVVM